MTILTKEKLQHVNSIAHEGKVVVLGTDADGKIWYSVKQDGFEDSYLSQPAELRTGWENWQQLEFPDEPDDASVISKETAELTYKTDTTKFVIKSRYRTKDQTAVAPVQLVSALGHIYVFRQSTTNTLLVDRFILDGMTNKLNRKLEVRFKRSRQKHEPTKNMKKVGNNLNNIDSLDFRDANGINFYEPTTELSTINNLQKGWFAVVLVPTIESDIYRWHIFAYNSQTQKVELTTIRASDEGLFEIKDYTILEESDNTLLPRRIPGIIKRRLDIGSVTINNGLAATKYDLQESQMTQSGEEQLLKTATRLMLAVPTTTGTAALSFAIAGDGTLAQIDETPESSIIRSNQREVLLPLNTLDEIKAFGDRTPPPQGIILGLAEGSETEDAEDLVKISTNNQAAGLVYGDLVKITGTQDYQGLYATRKIDNDTFEINIATGTELGYWEKQDKEEGGLIFDGMITAYEKTADGKLKVTCANHGLDNGDQVQISGTDAYNNTYPVKKIDDTHFVIERKWATGEAVNVKLVALKRRGIVFDGVDDYVEVPYSAELNPSKFTISCWAKVGGGQGTFRSVVTSRDVKTSNTYGYIIYAGDNNKWQFWVGNNTQNWIKVTGSDIVLNQWTHIAATFDGNKAKLYINGVFATEVATTYVANTERPVRIGTGATEGTAQQFFSGQIADVLIWKVARTAADIKNSMYLQLTGKELGLVGYWRLGGISEGKVIDFADNGSDGTVYSDPYVGAMTLNRKLGDNTTDAVKYGNSELFAVSQRATYEESFEFKVTSTTTINLASLDNADGRNLGTKIFTLSYWGKTSRSAEERKPISVVTQNQFEDVGGGWFRVSANVTIPDGVSMLRSFEIANIKGTWTSLEIRKHRIQLLSNSITQAGYNDSVTLTTLVENRTALTAKLKELEIKEKQQEVLLLEKKEINAKIAAYNALAATRARIAILESNIATYTTEVATLLSQYNTEKENSLNYCFHIAIFLSNDNVWSKLKVYENNDNDNTNLVQSYDAITNLCKLVDVGGGNYFLQIKVNDSWKYLTVANNSDGDNINLKRHATSAHFCRLMPTATTGDYYLLIQVGISFKGLHVYNQYGDWNNSLVRHSGLGNKLRFTTTSEPANDKIAVAQQAWEVKTQQLNEARTELLLLQSVNRATASDKAAWDTRIAELNTQITTIQTAINTLNTDFINAVKIITATPQTMPQVATNGKGLVTKGAVLGFVQSASRLSAIETCEGNVQLSYFDTQGRMRMTNYDATADSLNPTFEEWLPDNLPVGLNLANDNNKIQLTNSIYLSQESTIETWFSYPLPEKSCNTLASSANDIDRPIVVYQGKWLGTQINGFFYNSGYNLETLASGWHHLAAIEGGSEEKATITFYIDGKKVGEAKSFTALSFDGVNDYIEVAAHPNPTAAITVTLWAKSNTDNWNDEAFLASKRNAYILSPTKNSKQIKFSVYAASSWKSVEYTPSDIKQWHHYAGTFDGQNLKLYIDGVQVASNYVFTTTTPIASDSGSLYIGKDDENSRYFNGQIAEVSVWNYPRTNDQILSDMGKVLQGNESGLVGYWRFTASLAKDLSSNQKNGTFQGEPQAVNLLAKTTSYIEVIGNSQVGSEQFGKILEFRVWHLALKDEEIAVNSKTRLSGNEPGLVAYYPLNEATGTEVRDKTGSGNKGTVVGSWWGCNAPIGNLGHQVMEFDGIDDYIEVAAHTNPTAAITVSLWAKSNTDNWNEQDTLASKRDSYILSSVKDSKQIKFSIYANAVLKSVDYTPSNINQWHHYTGTFDGQTLKLYIDGVQVASNPVSTTTTAISSGSGSLYIGKNATSSKYFNGQIAEVRIWNTARTREEIQGDMYQHLTGKESGLVGYWPLNSIKLEANSQKVLDLTANNNHGTVNGAIIKNSNTLPIGGNALVSAEYSTITIDKVSNAKTAIMRRFFASPALNGVELLPDKRIEQLELKWIGNAQFAPTLLGYIEGAPPVPSENLTLSDDYNGATSVELTMSEDVAFSWNRSQDSGLGANLETFIGADSEIYAGLGVTAKLAGFHSGFKGNLDFSYQFQNQSNITSSSSLSMTDKLELRGTPEESPNFPHLGNRFIPKNVGYALVVSSLADVFISKLARSGKMIGYQVQPVDGIPPDINTITFLMNPSYTMNGSLDGLTGSSATSQRFFKHVPQMRAQYGSLYPASYYRLQEAYNLKRAIEKADKDRESYFSNFDVRSIDETSLNRNINTDDAPTIGVEREEDKASTPMSEEEKQKAQEQKAAQIKAESAALVKQQSAATKAKQSEIQSKIDDQEQRVHATECFAGWQKRMEKIQIQAGKRNIFNTYVWDADGGLRTEAQSFANTVEHTIGGSFSLNAGLGFEGKFAAGAAVELTTQATINMTQTMSKTESRSKGFQLNVDLSGLEFRGITNYNDRPILPGEKVDRYRFMSFYLEGSTQNFQDFFSYVVDPEWLASNDEEARALRQTQAGKPNKAWRVLHRVTYVERPALMGFGQDVRTLKPAPAISETQKLLDKITKLEANNQKLEAKIDLILKSLAK